MNVETPTFEKQKRRLSSIEGKEDSLGKELLKFILKQAFMYLIFPLVPILSYFQLLLGNNEPERNLELNNDGHDLEETARELALIFFAVEAPTQILFTSWLILRGIVRSPLNFGDVEIISWSTDKFGNPIPVPTIPLASITSSASLLLAATRIIFSSWPSLDCVEFLNFLSKLSFILFSISYILALSFLWIYLDSKTSFLILTLLILNFILAYRWEIRRKHKRNLPQPKFEIWFTSFVGIFIPCWYFRNVQKADETKPIPNLSIQTTVFNTFILVWLILYLLLVNWSSYRYKNKCLYKQDFNFACGFLIIIGTIHVAKNISWLNSSKKLMLTRNIVTLFTNVVIFILSISCIFFYNSLSHINPKA
jgi:hypothetical protein